MPGAEHGSSTWASSTPGLLHSTWTPPLRLAPVCSSAPTPGPLRNAGTPQRRTLRLLGSSATYGAGVLLSSGSWSSPRCQNSSTARSLAPGFLHSTWDPPRHWAPVCSSALAPGLLGNAGTPTASKFGVLFDSGPRLLYGAWLLLHISGSWAPVQRLRLHPPFFVSGTCSRRPGDSQVPGSRNNTTDCHPS